MVRAPGRDHDVGVHLVEHADVEALQEPDAGPQRLLEVELAAHRLLGHPGDLRLVPGMGGQHLDDLALDQGRVDVEHDQPHPAAQQVGRLHRDVDPLGGGLGGQPGAQHVRVGAGDVEVDRRHGVAGHPLDPVDVAAAVGDPAGDRGHRRGAQRGADDGDVRAALPAGAVVARAAVEVDGHPEVGRGLLHGALQPLPVARRGDQDAEDQPPAQQDLLDVDHEDAGLRERGEHRRRHARPVLAGQGDQQGRGLAGPR